MVLRALRAVGRAAASLLGSPGPASVDDLAVVPQVWVRHLDADVMPVLAQVWQESADHLGAALVDAGWPDGTTLTPTASDYLAVARNRLRNVGDEVWESLREDLAAGIAAGEGVRELADRIEQAAGVGPARAERIARTETIAASNAASLAVANLANIPGTTKEWLATPDTRTREAHRLADGQRVPLGDAFQVGGFPMRFPGDPSGPADQTVNCRCSLAYLFGDDVIDEASADGPLTAAAEVHTGAMVALIPSEEDAARLAVDGGEPADQLHTTLLYLGDAADYPANVRDQVIAAVEAVAVSRGPLTVEGFAVSVFNPPGVGQPDGRQRDTCIVLGLSGEELDVVHGAVTDGVNASLMDQPVVVPDQHAPWHPHITLIYTDDIGQAETLADRVGPVTFDRIRVAFAGENIDFPLVADLADDPDDEVAEDDDYDWESHIAEAIRVQLQSRMPAQLQRFWIKKLRLGTPGSFRRCVRQLRRHYPVNPEGLCANLYHEATGRWPGRRRDNAAEPEPALDATPPTLADEPMPVDPEPVEEVAVPAPEDVTVDPMAFQPGEHWHAIMITEGVSTGYRMFTSGALTWRDLPFAFHWQNQSSAHGGSPSTLQVGNVTRVERMGDEIHGWGSLDLGSPEGREYGRRLVDGFSRWVSIGLDETFRESDVEYVWPAGVELDGVDVTTVEPDELIISRGRIGELTAVSVPAQQEAIVEPSPELIDQFAVEVEEPTLVAAAVGPHDTPTTDGEWDSDTQVERLPSPMPVETARAMYAWIDDSRIEDGMIVKDACKFPHHEVSDDGSPGAANLTACSAAIGALHGARTEPDIPDDDRRGVYDHVARHLRDGDMTPPEFGDHGPTVIVAAGHTITIPNVPPAHWFAEPTDVIPQGALTVTDEGRVYGYLAPAGLAHRAFRSRRQEVPMRNVDYGRWMGGEALVAGGRAVAGPITMNCGHMPPTASADSTVRMEHYDNTCSVVAQAAIGENSHGVWIAGALLPGVTAEQVTRMMACRLSGDWAPHPERPGWKEFVAALLVPVPGFPMARSGPSVRIADGALVAAAVPVRMADPEPKPEPEEPAAPTPDLSPTMDRLARAIGMDYGSRMARLKDRIGATDRP